MNRKKKNNRIKNVNYDQRGRLKVVYVCLDVSWWVILLLLLYRDTLLPASIQTKRTERTPLTFATFVDFATNNAVTLCCLSDSVLGARALYLSLFLTVSYYCQPKQVRACLFVFLIIWMKEIVPSAEIIVMVVDVVLFFVVVIKVYVYVTHHFHVNLFLIHVLFTIRAALFPTVTAPMFHRSTQRIRSVDNHWVESSSHLSCCVG